MKQKPYALIAALMAALSMPAFLAQAQTGLPVLQRLDQNKDSAVSREEILAARGKLFARLDVDGDGAIDQDETEQLRDAIMDHAIAMQAFLGRQMRRLDTSGDGNVSTDEFRARAPLFDLADRDRDEKLSDGEFLVIRGILVNR
jgi:Ca2+-binding EF-hand superfamily protein